MSLFKMVSIENGTENSLEKSLEKNLENSASIKESTNLRNTHLAAMAATLYIVVSGMVSSYSSPATVDMKKPGSIFSNITSSEIAWIASLPGIAAVIGGPISGYLSQKLGRKAVLIYISVPFLAGWLLIAYATSVYWIYVGRLLSGFCVGIVTVTVPAYVVEIATVEIRGRLTSWFQLSFAVGVLLTMTFGLYLRWNWLAVTGAIIVTTTCMLMYFMPESPPWLISKGYENEAIQSIRFLKGKKVDSLNEFNIIHNSLASQPKRGIAITDFRHPTLYKPLMLAIGLMFFQQFSGINALMAYTVEIFEKAESSLDPAIAAAIVAGVQVLSTLISSTLMDKAGRRVLYIVSGIFVTIGLCILGVYGIISKYYEVSNKLGWIPLAGFVIFVASFSLGYGPIPWVMTPEMIPIHTRSTVLAVAGVANSFFMFIVTKTFDDLRVFLSDYGVYWVYGTFSLLGCIFCWICLPETKGKTVEDIQSHFTSSTSFRELQEDS